MKLTDIAAKLRTAALAAPGVTQSEPLFHGAVCGLRAEISDNTADGLTLVEWHLQIRREGKLPNEDTPAYTAWLRELKTFRAPLYFNVPDSVQPTMQAGKRTYAANFVWTERVEPTEFNPTSTPRRAVQPVKVAPIPQNAAEISAWAKGLGQGVKITGVDVVTGEIG